jgi:hypothetical protein
VPEAQEGGDLIHRWNSVGAAIDMLTIMLLRHRGKIRQMSVSFSPDLGHFGDVNRSRFDEKLC